MLAGLGVIPFLVGEGGKLHLAHAGDVAHVHVADVGVPVFNHSFPSLLHVADDRPLDAVHLLAVAPDDVPQFRLVVKLPLGGAVLDELSRSLPLRVADDFPRIHQPGGKGGHVRLPVHDGGGDVGHVALPPHPVVAGDAEVLKQGEHLRFQDEDLPLPQELALVRPGVLVHQRHLRLPPGPLVELVDEGDELLRCGGGVFVKTAVDDGADLATRNDVLHFLLQDAFQKRLRRAIVLLQLIPGDGHGPHFRQQGVAAGGMAEQQQLGAAHHRLQQQVPADGALDRVAGRHLDFQHRHMVQPRVAQHVRHVARGRRRRQRQPQHQPNA